ncbi:hypothetical protein LLH06_16730 [Mucilaginibacter daejeonensis]|uniref:phage exclusion protein Lit family protein n=1 Tax=Mucilaginibacter daejeonensis TaxID=398049 RepID=UPI001D1721E6|nr:phage exclusion protein Lit family protein [Mucilaginibacter daejeonensis]UEG52602.1 hypothetical protein LLH06_16730 [Mucilaginibacter daejeonensis]
MEEQLRPIHYLDHNVKEAFEHFASQLSQVRRAGISKATIGIELTEDEEPARTPVADLNSNLIKLNVNHLSYVWTCCYFFTGMQDLYYKAAMQDKPVVILEQTPVVNKMNHTFYWGRSLNSFHSEWPSNTVYPSSNEPYVEGANTIFLYAVCYLMFHELGHLVLHRDLTQFIQRVKGRYYEKTIDDVRRIRNMERQADSYALDCMLSTASDDRQRYMIAIGAIVGIFTMFYSLQNTDIRGGTHPDLDDRLKLVMKSIKLTEEYHSIHMQATSSIGLQTFLKLTETEFRPEGKNLSYADFKELEKDIFDLLSDTKAKYNQRWPFNFKPE